MIAIRINRTYWLQLYADTKLDITLTSPVFSDKVIEENSVYNFTIPNTPHNAGILGHPGRVETLANKGVRYGVEIFWSGNHVGAGTLLIRKTTRKDIEVVAGLNDSSFYSLVGDKLISDFSYGGERVFYADSDTVHDNVIAKMAGKTQAESDWAFFTVNNPSLYAARAGELAEDIYMNRGNYYPLYDPTNARPYQNDYFPGEWPTNQYANPRTNKSSITPFPYLGYVLGKIFEESGYYVYYNAFTKVSQLSKICVYNPCITPVRRVSMNNYMCYIHLDEHLPKMKVSEFLAATRGIAAANFQVNERDKMVNIRHFDLLSDERIKTDQYMTKETELVEPTSLRFKMSVDGSDDYASDFQKPDEIEKARNRGTYATVAGLSAVTAPVIGDIALVEDDNYFYRYEQTDEAVFVWTKFAFNIQNVIDGDEENITDVETQYSAAYSERRTVRHFTGPNIDDYADDSWCTPRVDIEGNCRKMGIGPNIPYKDFDLKLMLNWGMTVTETYGIDYPAGSSSGIMYGDYTPTWRNFSLIPGHEYNYVDTFLTRYNRVRKNMVRKSVIRKMNISEISEIDFMRTELMDGRTWLVNKVNFSLGNKGVSIVEVEYVQLTM